MNKQKGILISIIVIALTLSVSVSLANAGNTFNLDCNPGSCKENDQVTFTATTSWSSSCQVKFTLTKPGGGQIDSGWLSVTRISGGNHKANWNCILSLVGDWSVDACFKYSGSNHHCYATVTCYEYDLVCDPPCGSDVDLGTTVKTTAKTTNSAIYKVTFTWITPTGEEIPYTTTTRYTKMENGKAVYCFDATKTVNALGNWCVEAKFIDKQGYCWCQKDVVVACRKQNFSVVPEIPLLGTVGASIAMLGGLAFKIKRKTA